MSHSLSIWELQRLKQSYRITSAGNSLAIRKAGRCNNSEPYILRLPDELLHSILILALEPPESIRSYHSYTTAHSLCITCKRFSRIATPLLYYAIYSENSRTAFVKPMEFTKSLHRTLKANPALRTLCKKLKVHISDVPKPVASSYLLADEMLPWFTEVKDLEIWGGFENTNMTWPVLRRSVKYMPHLENLKLFREGWGILLGSVRSLELPGLKNLQISGVSPASSNAAGTCSPEDSIVKTQDGTGTFTELTISDFDDSPAALARFLEWPAALSHFAFHGLGCLNHNWDFGSFETILANHQSTLVSVQLGALHEESDDRTGTINVSQYPILNTLHLSHHDLTCTPEVAASTILAPVLHTLIIDYRLDDQFEESWNFFRETDATWIQKFGLLAIARGSSLREIKIIFAPENIFLWAHIPVTEIRYPWDLMEGVKEHLAPKGIRLLYAEPSIQKQQFAEMIAERIESRVFEADLAGFYI